MAPRILDTRFTAGLNLNVFLTRQRSVRWIEQRVTTPLFVRLTEWIRGARDVPPTAEALGREGERLLGSRPVAHVTSVEGETVFGEITAVCPLRGTGDVAACHRLMGYDRGLVGRHGGRFVVLESQAEPGRTSCRVAIRPFDVDASDLVPAHVCVAARCT